MIINFNKFRKKQEKPEVCLFCGKTKDGVAIEDLLKNDIEFNITQEPCKKCSANMSKGFTFFEVSEKAQLEGQPCVTSDEGEELYLTGNYVVTQATKEHLKGDFALCKDFSKFGGTDNA